MTFLVLEDAAGATEVTFLASADGVIYGAFQACAGVTASTLSPAGGRAALQLHDAAGATVVVFPRARGRRLLTLQDAAGSTQSYIGSVPDLSDNPPMELAMALSGQYVCYPPIEVDE